MKANIGGHFFDFARNVQSIHFWKEGSTYPRTSNYCIPCFDYSFIPWYNVSLLIT